jgi:hypothetical protein
MAEEQEKAVTEAAVQVIREYTAVTWYWSFGEIDELESDHECSPDCDHWKDGSESKDA